MNRMELPYRKNCEGYFLYKDRYVIAQDTGLGYIEFPGGGVDGDDVADAMRREATEETGAVIADLAEYELIYFDWGPTWAKTDKQKMRYQQFRGEEMHLFTGVVTDLNEPTGDLESGEPGWPGERFIDKDELIQSIEAMRPFTPEMYDYHEKQLEILRSLQSDS